MDGVNRGIYSAILPIPLPKTKNRQVSHRDSIQLIMAGPIFIQQPRAMGD